MADGSASDYRSARLRNAGTRLPLPMADRPSPWRAVASLALVCTGLGCEAPRAGDQPPGTAGGEVTAGTGSSDSLYRSADSDSLGVAVAILIDNSGSMAARAPGDARRKYVMAREATRATLGVTREHLRNNPGYPIKIGIYRFADDVQRVLPMVPYDSAEVAQALASFPTPDGNTAIGDAMEAARADLYDSGLIRKYILVITDGENTAGRDPREVVAEIARRSQGGVGIYYIAFDVDAENFAFVRSAGGDVLPARGGAQLRSALAEVYRGRILAESEDYGDAFPQAAGGAASQDTATRSRQP